MCQEPRHKEMAEIGHSTLTGSFLSVGRPADIRRGGSDRYAGLVSAGLGYLLRILPGRYFFSSGSLDS
jgi:hypothetical protein